MYSRHRRQAGVVFAVVEIVLTLASFEAAYRLRAAAPFDRNFFLDPPVRALLAATAVSLWAGLALWIGVYGRIVTAGRWALFQDTFQQVALGGIGMVLVEYLARLDLSRSFLGLFAAISGASLLLLRWNAEPLARKFRREFGATRYVLLVGSGERAARLERLLADSAEHGVRLVSAIPESEAPARVPELLNRQIVDEIIFAVDPSRLAELEELFLLCDEEGVRTRVAVDLFPHVNSDVYLERLGQAPLLTFAASPHDELRLAAKRAIDLLAAIPAALLLAPFLAAVAVAIRATSKGPAIFRQVRCGLNGRPFVFYKFRSMIENADELKASLEHLNERTTAFKISNDPRLTPLGRWLRKFSIDELPQLWNVIRGDMSLVGPRPAVPQEVDRYERWQRRRLRMRPGLTCLWAIEGRDRLDFETWMRLDLAYIDNWSLTLDLEILLKTIPHVLTGRGAH